MAAENAIKQGVSNVRFVNSGADYLPRYIKEDSIENIYLNFSPPFPQDGYESHRLTNPRLVNDYKRFLKSGGTIFQKTDDKLFFDYSFKKFVENGFLVDDVSDQIDLPKYGNVVTEYESKFKKLGIKINALTAKKS